MAPEKEKDAPAKSQAPCLGMLACFGMAALVGEPPLLPKTQEHIRTLAPDSAAPGLTHPPENPPPIA